MKVKHELEKAGELQEIYKKLRNLRPSNLGIRIKLKKGKYVIPLMTNGNILTHHILIINVGGEERQWVIKKVIGDEVKPTPNVYGTRREATDKAYKIGVEFYKEYADENPRCWQLLKQYINKTKCKINDYD